MNPIMMRPDETKREYQRRMRRDPAARKQIEKIVSRVRWTFLGIVAVLAFGLGRTTKK